MECLSSVYPLREPAWYRAGEQSQAQQDSALVVAQAAPRAAQSPAPADTGNVPMTDVTVTAQKDRQPKEGAAKAEAGNGFVERKQNETATQDTVTKEAITWSAVRARQTSSRRSICCLP